jgi:ABC-type transporter Mla maintaining outer membrane lipid asymmetry permease subunit MlaE
LTTIGVPYTQRLILAKVVALALSQPLVGLWTSAIALLGGMVAAHLSLGVSYYDFLDAIPKVVPVANYWIGLGKGVVFGLIIALVLAGCGSLEGSTSTAMIVVASGKRGTAKHPNHAIAERKQNGLESMTHSPGR